MYAIEIRIAPEITSYSCAKLDISFKRSDLQKSEGVQMYIELFCRSERLKMMFRFDARIGSYFGRDPYLRPKNLTLQIITNISEMAYWHLVQLYYPWARAYAFMALIACIDKWVIFDINLISIPSSNIRIAVSRDSCVFVCCTAC